MTASKISTAMTTSSEVTINGGQKRRVLSPQLSSSSPFSKHCLHDLIAKLSVGGMAAVLPFELDADHQSETAHIADHRVTYFEIGQLRPLGRRPTAAEFSTKPSSSNAIVANAAAQATGLPPNVLPWVLAVQVLISSRAIIAPSGMPLAMPLATQRMSGSMPQCSHGEHLAGSAETRTESHRPPAACRACGKAPEASAEYSGGGTM